MPGRAVAACLPGVDAVWPTRAIRYRRYEGRSAGLHRQTFIRL